MLELSLMIKEAEKAEKINQIMLCNDVSMKYDMVLKKEEIIGIIETQQAILKSLERVEFGGTIIEQIIYAFCDSPFISKYEYGNVIDKLVEIFYWYKSDLDQLLNDEDIIEYMQRAFNGPCQGSFDYLEDGQLWALINALEEKKDIYEDDEYGCF